MKRPFLLLAACLLLVGVAHAQQDPNDPGIQDSIIIGTALVDTFIPSVFVPIYAVTDDSVAVYILPLGWSIADSGFDGAQGTVYFPPLDSWDEHYGTVMLDDDYFRMIGWKDVVIDSTPNTPLHTNGVRQHIMSVPFTVSPFVHWQLVVLDTVYDPCCGSLVFGLSDGLTVITPGFQRGFITVGNVGVDEPASLPIEFKLAQNYPNPFNPETNIEFSLPKALDVTVLIYNLLGQQVRTLVNGRVEAGVHSVRWDGRNDNGADVPSGVYFYRLYSSEFSQTNKMVLVR